MRITSSVAVAVMVGAALLEIRTAVAREFDQPTLLVQHRFVTKIYNDYLPGGRRGKEGRHHFVWLGASQGRPAIGQRECGGIGAEKAF